VLVALGVVTASCSAGPGVASIRADRTVDSDSTRPLEPPPEEAVDERDGERVAWEAIAEHPDGAVFALAGPAAEAEFAIHALVGAGRGWWAVGSTTPPGGVGVASAWLVDPEGTFGPATPLPAPPGVPSVARDAVSVFTSTVVVGAQGAGRQSLPTVWTRAAGGEWTMAPLPVDMAELHGATVDRVVSLLDGSIVVVGRADGPFFKELVVWTSRDGGATWTTTPISYEAFREPLVATDGTQLVLFFQTYPQVDNGLAGYRSVTVEFGGVNIGVVGMAEVDLTPDARYWPQDLEWDGSQFVMALQADVEPALAVSANGLSWSIVPVDPAGRSSGSPASVVALARLGDALVVGVEERMTLSLHRWDGTALTLYDTPRLTSGNLAYLANRKLFAADASKLAYVGADWDDVTLLVGDGSQWSVRSVDELPTHRTPSRREIREVVGSAGSQLALVATSSTVADGRFESGVDGALWRPPGVTTWFEYGWLPDGTVPQAVTTWRGSYALAGYDGSSDWSSLYLVDPITGETNWLSGFSGWVDAVVADETHLYARVKDETGTSTLWWSAEGLTWDQVDLGDSPRSLCSDGTIAVVEAMTSDGGDSSVSLYRLDGPNADAAGPPFEFRRFEVLPEQEQTMRCGVNGDGALTTVQGYDSYIASESPQSWWVTWEPRPTSFEDIVLPLSEPGAWYSSVSAVTWSGSRWIAVGSGHDVEMSQDALMWTSVDGIVWDPPVTIAGGPGNQGASAVFVDGPTLSVGGFAGSDAMIWSLPA
jgi:hypothetical protein